jgi:nucleoside-diphosphate-sugar epimerase
LALLTDGAGHARYIDNVVGGSSRIDAKALGQAFNMADDCLPYREFYLAYARMMGRLPLPTIPGVAAFLARLGPAQLLRRVLGRPSVGPWSLHFRFNPSQFSVAKAQRLLGYKPKVSFDEGMRRTEQWLRENGHLSAVRQGPLRTPADLAGVRRKPYSDERAGNQMHM